MIIGIPRERKTLEKRVAITPDGVFELVSHGHKVLIEKGAGLASALPDELYQQSGATIIPTLAEVWQTAELLVKVKEPAEEEYQFFRPGLAIFDFLHLASMPVLTKAMVSSGVTGIAYELVRTADGRLPLLEPMSEIAGRLAVLNGANHLLSQHGGEGILLSGALGVPPGHVVIVGAGIAGRNACDAAVGFGARVTILDRDVRKLEWIDLKFGKRVSTLHATKASLTRAVADADLLIGAVLVPGAQTPKIISREMIKAMRKGSVLVDISIDQGGCAETIKPTSLDAPVFEVEGVIHYGVCNMPAQTPKTSTLALTAVTLPYILQIANQGLAATLKSNSAIRGAVNTHAGALTNEEVARAVGMPFSNI